MILEEIILLKLLKILNYGEKKRNFQEILDYLFDLNYDDLLQRIYKKGKVICKEGDLGNVYY